MALLGIVEDCGGLHGLLDDLDEVPSSDAGANQPANRLHNELANGLDDFDAHFVALLMCVVQARAALSGHSAPLAVT